MCGIVGVNFIHVGGAELFNLLKKLEYRGYDSAGLAVLKKNVNQIQMNVIKKAGTLENLRSLSESLSGSIGIGHTRWATHGHANEANAHPHFSEKIALVHNGIIENYRELKKDLENFQFKSETDTEVLLALLDSFDFDQENYLFNIAKVVKQLKGVFSICFIIKSIPDRLFVVKNGAPLAVGLSRRGVAVASDVVAFPLDIEQYSMIPDQTITVLKQHDAMCFNFQLDTVNLNFQSFFTEKKSEKLNEDCFFLQEIKEQPELFAEILNSKVSRYNIDKKLTGVQDLNLGKINHIQIIGCGSAFHAALFAKYFLEKYTIIPISVDVASEFLYSDKILTAKSLIIAISQSGETADVLASVRKAKGLGCQVLSFCNRKNSELCRISDKTILLDCGVEVSVASTKVLISMLLHLFLFSLSFAQNRGQLQKEKKIILLNKIKNTKEKMQKIIENNKKIEEFANILQSEKDVFFIGRKSGYILSLEGSLKLKELSYIHVEAFAGGELKHGSLALIETGVPVVALFTQDIDFEKMHSSVIEAQTRGANVLAIGIKKYVFEFDNFFAFEDANEVEECFLITVVLQLLAYYTAKKLGRNIDQPRNLAKSVTVE